MCARYAPTVLERCPLTLIINLTPRSDAQVRALCALTAMDLAPSPPCTAARLALATPFDKPEEAERPRSPRCKAVASEDQRTPLAQWPSESDGSEWLVTAEARLEAPAASFWDTVGTAGARRFFMIPVARSLSERLLAEALL